MIRLVARVVFAVLLVYFAAEFFGGQWPWLVEHQGWLTFGAIVVAVWR